MWSGETKEFLESGCALVVATVSSDGAPFASRGWGLTIVRGGDFRLLLDADDPHTIANLEATGVIAITATNVPTLHSMQMKGRCLTVEPATDVDRARAARYCDEFFTDIVTTEGTDPRLPERLRPAGVIACEVTIDECFDQTPGPAAGSVLAPP